jgi:Recombinase
VILVPGPESEVAVVASIYKNFVDLRKTESEIARGLNVQGRKTSTNRPWTRADVHKILVSPKYAGANVFNRHSVRLGQKKVRNPPEMWVRCDSAFQPLVSNQDFYKAQAIISGRPQRFTSEAMLDELRGLLRISGRLNAGLINQARGMPSSATYCHRFGGLDQAYQQVGWTRIGNLNNVESSRRFKASRRNIISAILQAIKSCGADLQSIDPYGLLAINNEFTASVKVARCVHNRAANGWKVSFDRSLPPDLTLIVRMAAGNESILDYYVLPSTNIPSKALYIGEHTTMALNSFRFDNLDFFLSLCKRKPIKGAT